MSEKDEFGAPFQFPIEAGKIREFARAVLDDNPFYRDEEEAKRWGCSNIPAPPTFAMTSAFVQTPESQVPLKLDFLFALHGEQEFEYLAPIVAGDELTGRARISERFEKKGKRGGTMLFVVVETQYENQRGERVLNVRQTLIQPEGTIKE